MSETDIAPTDVEIRDLDPVRVVALDYEADELTGSYVGSIRALFLEVEGWVETQGYDTQGLRRFGVPFFEGDRMTAYWCCVEAPDALTAAAGDFALRELPGGRYALLRMNKDSSTVGPTIRRFHDEYVPAHGLRLDPARPPIELYSANTMVYCAPLLAED